MKTTKLVDRIATGITSLEAVIMVLLFSISGMVLFSHSLFANVFPGSMTIWERSLATWFWAVAWEATVLITTVNTKHLNKHVPAVMAMCSGVIVLFFIGAFDEGQGWLTLMQRWFVGILAATINWIYSDLFYAKFKERSSVLDAPMKVIELESTVNHLRSALDDADSQLKELTELKRFKTKITKELTCPHCKIEHASFGSLHAHKGHCSENPKRKGTVN